MNKLMRSLLAGLAILLLVATAASAAQVAVQVPDKSMDLGGLPPYVTFTATSAASPAEIDFAVPAGFVADYVMVITARATAADKCEWFYGMPAASAVVTDGAADAGDTTWITTLGVTSVSGSLKIGTGCQTANGVLHGIAFRYAGP